MLRVHSPKKFDYFLRVYYGDTDCGSVVYHARYLDFMERARSEWLIEMGYNENIMKEQNAFFAVSSSNLNFIKPAKLYDLLVVESNVVKVNSASIELEQIVKNSENLNLVFCRGYIKVVCVNKKMKPVGISNLLKRKIENDS